MFTALMFLLIIYFCGYGIVKVIISDTHTDRKETLTQNGFCEVKNMNEILMFYDRDVKYYSAIKNEEKYLVLDLKTYFISKFWIDSLLREVKEYHFDKGILIYMAEPKQSLIDYGKEKSIEVTSIFKLKNSANNNLEETDNINLEEEYPIEEQEDPINKSKQSFLEKLLKKPDRL